MAPAFAAAPASLASHAREPLRVVPLCCAARRLLPQLRLSGARGVRWQARWQRLTWVFLPHTFSTDRVGRLREAPRRDGKVEVRWGDWETSVEKAAKLVENPGGWGALTEKQRDSWCAPTTS